MVSGGPIAQWSYFAVAVWPEHRAAAQRAGTEGDMDRNDRAPDHEGRHYEAQPSEGQPDAR